MRADPSPIHHCIDRLRGAEVFEPSTDRLLLELLNGRVDDEVRIGGDRTVTTNAFRRELRVCDRLLEEVSAVSLSL